MSAHGRFTEVYLEELENEGDLRILVCDYLKGLNPHRNIIAGIIRSDPPQRPHLHSVPFSGLVRFPRDRTLILRICRNDMSKAVCLFFDVDV